MSSSSLRPISRARFQRVVLIDEPKRAVKMLRGGPGGLGVREGMLEVIEDHLVWTGPDRVVTLGGITFADVVRPGMIGVDYQGESGPAVAVLMDRRRGQLKQGPTTAALAAELRDALGLAPKTPEEEKAASDATVARAEAKMRSARVRMTISGLMAAGGAIATWIGYQNAEPGGRYTLWWGAIAFGLLWFIVGGAEYAGAAKERAAAGAPPAAPAPSSDGWGAPEVAPAAATEPVPAPAEPVELTPPSLASVPIELLPAGSVSPSHAVPSSGAAAPMTITRSRRPLILAAVALAIVAGIGLVIANSGGGDDDRRATTASSRPIALVEDQVRALTNDVDLGSFGSPAVQGVACPEPVPTQPRSMFDCNVVLSSDPGATMTVAWADDGSLAWCSFQSQGSSLLNLKAIPDPCSSQLPGTTFPPTTFPPSTLPQATAPPTFVPPAGRPPVANAISTSIGALPIDRVRFTDRHPVGCTPSDPACSSSTSNRIVVLTIRPAPGRDVYSTMSSITSEFFQSSIQDSVGGIAFAKSISSYGGDVIELVFDQITVDHPSTLTLFWPQAAPVSLSF